MGAFVGGSDLAKQEGLWPNPDVALPLAQRSQALGVSWSQSWGQHLMDTNGVF